jgi:hypothetical protein
MFIAPKIYPSRKDWIIKTVLVILILLDLIGTAYLYDEMNGKISEVLPFTTAITVMDVLIICIYLTTNYTLNENNLYCRSFIFTKRISYENIQRIEQNRKLFAGLKLSLASKGMVIYYNKGSELFITPENEEEFIEDLRFKNHSIEIR